MNGPMIMYDLKPVVQFSDTVELTPTMYRMKNIIFSSTPGSQDSSIFPNISEQVNKILQKPSQEAEKLEKRQNAILKQLNYLKEQMSVLREELAKKNLTGPSSVKQAGTSFHQTVLMDQPWKGVAGELVLHASPDCPPFSLLAVNSLWPELRLQVTCHAHSSISALPTHLDRFTHLAYTPSPNLQIRLIWKQMGPDCELVVSPLTHCPIRGEVNLLRYLKRSLTATQDPVSEVQLDSLLDVCHRLSHAHTVRDKQLAVRTLNTRLGQAPWLLGEVLSLADVAAWSALRVISGVELSQNMSKWQSRSENAFGVEGS